MLFNTKQYLPRLDTPRIIELKLGSLIISNDYSSLSPEFVAKATECYDLTKIIFKQDARKIKTIIIDSIRRKDPVAFIYKNNEVVGGVIATISEFMLFEGPLIVQSIYTSKLKGYEAVLAVKLAHRFLVEYGRRKGLYAAMSTCGAQDVDCHLTRILEKDGWQRQGHTAIFYLRN